jgi:hypothetical protein
MQQKFQQSKNSRYNELSPGLNIQNDDNDSENLNDEDGPDLDDEW